MIKQLYQYAKDYRREIIVGPIFKLMEAIFELLLPLCFATIINQGILKNEPAIIYKQSFYIFVFSILGLFCVSICQKMAAKASQGFGTNLREALFKKIQTFSPEQRQRFGSSSLMTRISNDTSQLQLALAMLIRLVIRAPFLSIGAIVMAWSMSPSLTLIFIATLPLFLITLLLIMKINLPFVNKLQRALEAFNQHVIENIQGTPIIRSLGKQRQFMTQLNDNAHDIEKVSIKTSFWTSLMSPMTTLIINVATVIILYLAAGHIHNHTLAIGNLVALINYLSQMLLALIVISNLIVTFSKAYSSGLRVTELLGATPKENINKKIEENVDNSIKLDRIDYRYANEKKDLFHQLSLSLLEHESVTITGEIGSGKSTLMQLLLGILQPTSGNIQWNNENILSHIKDYQYYLSYVPQHNVLFEGTVEDNLRFANPHASLDDIHKALKAADAYDFVMEDELGLERSIMKEGKNLSGGQRQRLCIARALLKPNARFLMMDDPFASLDTKTERHILDALKRDYPHLTRIMISQRYQSIVSSQRIIVLEHGEITGDDTHEQLLSYHPLYQSLMEDL